MSCQGAPEGRRSTVNLARLSAARGRSALLILAIVLFTTACKNGSATDDEAGADATGSISISGIEATTTADPNLSEVGSPILPEDLVIELDWHESCHSSPGTVRFHISDTRPHLSNIAVGMTVPISKEPETYDLTDVHFVVYFGTGGHAKNLSCSDVRVGTSDGDARTRAVSGQIVVEYKFDDVSEMPIEARLIATNLIFVNGVVVDEIATKWLKIGITG